MKIYYAGKMKTDIKTGGERRISNVLNYIKGQGVEVCFIEGDGSPGGRIRRNFLATNLWYMRYFLMKGLDQETIVIEDYSQRFYLFIFDIFARYKTNCEIISLVNAFYFQYRRSRLKNMIDRCISRIFFSYSNLIITGGRAAADELMRLGVRGGRIRVVYPALRDEFRNVLPGHEYSRKGPVFNLLVVGRIHPVKGIETLLDAVSMIGDAEIGIEIVGNYSLYPYYTANLMEKIKSLNIGDKIRLVGEVSDVNDLLGIYRGADLFILPSHWETSPSALIEAMCMGLPIVASDIGGIKEVITNEVNGLLVPPGDGKTLAAAILRFYIDEGLRRKLGEKAKADAEGYTKRTWADVGREYYEILSNHLGQGQKTR